MRERGDGKRRNKRQAERRLLIIARRKRRERRTWVTSSHCGSVSGPHREREEQPQSSATQNDSLSQHRKFLRLLRCRAILAPLSTIAPSSCPCRSICFPVFPGRVCGQNTILIKEQASFATVSFLTTSTTACRQHGCRTPTQQLLVSKELA